MRWICTVAWTHMGDQTVLNVLVMHKPDWQRTILLNVQLLRACCRYAPLHINWCVQTPVFFIKALQVFTVLFFALFYSALGQCTLLGVVVLPLVKQLMLFSIQVSKAGMWSLTTCPWSIIWAKMSQSSRVDERSVQLPLYCSQNNP